MTTLPQLLSAYSHTGLWVTPHFAHFISRFSLLLLLLIKTNFGLAAAGTVLFTSWRINITLPVRDVFSEALVNFFLRFFCILWCPESGLRIGPGSTRKSSDIYLISRGNFTVSSSPLWFKVLGSQNLRQRLRIQRLGRSYAWCIKVPSFETSVRLYFEVLLCRVECHLH